MGPKGVREMAQYSSTNTQTLHSGRYNAFEANKFQSYTNLPSRMERQKNRTMKASNDHLYSLIDKLQHPMPLNVRERELHLRKLQMGMSKAKTVNKTFFMPSATFDARHMVTKDEQSMTASIVPPDAPMLIDHHASGSPSLDTSVPGTPFHPRGRGVDVPNGQEEMCQL